MSEVKRYLIQKTPIGTMLKPNTEGNWVAYEDFDRVTAERDAALEDVEALKHWRDLALQFDYHRMKALWHLKTLVSDGAHYDAAAAFLTEPPIPASELQQRLTAADVLEGLLRLLAELPGVRTSGIWERVVAALKPTEGGGDAVGRVSLSDKALSLIDEEIRNRGLPW